MSVFARIFALSRPGRKWMSLAAQSVDEFRDSRHDENVFALKLPDLGGVTPAGRCFES